MAIYCNNLGSAYYSLGEYGKAIEYYDRALSIDRKNFGENHPKVAIRYNNLGAAYDSLGDHSKAIECFDRALAIFIQFLGHEHPNTKKVQRHLEAARKMSEP